jgi:titin
LERLEDRTVPSTFSVTNTGDNGGVNPAAGAGTGTLRQAIVDANAANTGSAGNPDLVQFNIPTTDPGYQSGPGAFFIKPLSALPSITDTVDLNGYTQAGASPNTLIIGDNAVLKIVLDGRLAGAVDGLVIEGGNSKVRGLVIDNFGYGSGIVLNTGGNDLVAGNFIGIDVTGESAAANNIGILTNSTGNLPSTGNTIGGTTPEARNIISGNNSALPYLAHGGSDPLNFGIDVDNSNLIQGNYIGMDKSGTYAVPNGTGIVIGSNNTIGGLTTTPGTGAGNLISGNIVFGIDRAGNQNLIAGNLIGTTATGLAALGNGAGVHVWGNNNTIGGTTVGSRNVISGNTGAGGAGFINAAIDIENVGAVLAGGSYNLVEGNYIGTDITGTTSLGGQTGIIIAGAYNTIGGTTAAARNVISGNNGFGIQSNGGFTGSFGNVIQGNYIGTDPSGTTVVRNLGYGVALTWGTHDNTIGGTLPGAGNVISGFNGILLRGLPSIGLPCTNNLVQGNLIGTD